MNPHWPGIEAFYAEDERREHSVERDLPGAWYMETYDRYRLTWLTLTGELVAVSETDVELLAWVDGHERAVKLVDGWQRHAGVLKSFYWVRQRVHKHREGGKVIEGVDVVDLDRDRAAASAGSLF